MPLDETVAADIHRDDAAVLAGSSGRAALDPARAEDVVQEVILRVWRQAPEVTSMRADLADHAQAQPNRTSTSTTMSPWAGSGSPSVETSLDLIMALGTAALAVVRRQTMPVIP